MDQTHEPILLQPPIPFIWNEWGAGFVYQINGRDLVVSGPKQQPPKHGQLILSLAEHQSLVLENVTAEEFLSDIEDPEVDADRSGKHLLRVNNDSCYADLISLLRKKQHIDICARQDVESSDKYTGLSEVHFVPRALIDSGVSKVDTTMLLFDRTFALPFLITGMTGGLEQGAKINMRLARAAVAMGIPMGVGSQRVALENPKHASIFRVKQKVPDVFLIGNLGCGQIVSATSDDEALSFCNQAIEMIEADALAIHLNILQELIQVEGDRDFSGLKSRLAYIARHLEKPLMVKEVGAGLDANSGRQLFDFGIRTIDVGGKGGTSWGYIEGLRSSSELVQNTAKTFRDFGLPTAFALTLLQEQIPNCSLIATGGIRTGLDVAKAVALGASACGIGLPLFRAALESEQEPFKVLQRFEKELQTVMLITGSENLSALKNKLCRTFVFDRELDSWRITNI